MVQLTGLMLCLNGAAKITHRAQRIIGIVSQWHALATCNPHAVTDSQRTGEGDSNDPALWSSTIRGPAHPCVYNDSSDESDSDDEEQSPRHSTSIKQAFHDMENYQKRHALCKNHLASERPYIIIYFRPRPDDLLVPPLSSYWSNEWCTTHNTICHLSIRPLSHL